MNKLVIAGVLALVVAVVGYASVFTVNMTQQALVLQFGDIKNVVKDPGLHFKLPFIQNVVYIDKRVINLNSKARVGGETEDDLFITSDQKRLLVDAFARYKIVDPLQFYRSVGNKRQGNSRLRQKLLSSIRNVIGDATLEALVRDNRLGLMQKIQEGFNDGAAEFGVEVVDVRIRRADLPNENSRAIYQRMETERQREAAEFRAQGRETAQRIRSRADRDVTVLVAEAERDAQIIRGEGDAARNKIFADAFGKDPEFFAFYRSMQAYEAGLKGDSTTMVLSPDSDFFRYFGNLQGRN